MLVLFGILLFGGSTGNSPVVDSIARSQEIIRISSSLGTQQGIDTNTKDLAVTVKASLSSQQQQLIAYLKSKGTKIDPAKEVIYKNSSTDAQISSATQNNDLLVFYKSYLKTNLPLYESALQKAYASADSKDKPILSNAYTSSQTILSSIGS